MCTCALVYLKDHTHLLDLYLTNQLLNYGQNEHFLIQTENLNGKMSTFNPEHSDS
jgi:hypothetical protein